MDDDRVGARTETLPVEVRVWRHGELVDRELCESEEQAAAVVRSWSELDGVDCDIDDLTVRHTPDEIADPEPPEPDDEEAHVEAVEAAAEEARSRLYD